MGTTRNSLSSNIDDFDNTLTEDDRMTYTLISTSNKIPFEVDRLSGSIIVARPLDREIAAEHRFEVKAFTGGGKNSIAVSVLIELSDVNDNAPQWGSDPISISVSEDAKLGFNIFNYTAIDIDDGKNGELRYFLKKQHPSDVFALDTLTGSLSLIKTLDYEVVKEYIIIVEAVDQSTNISERLKTAVTTHIFIKDVNDNSPYFVWPSSTLITVRDIGTLGSELFKVIAWDKDSGENGRITYAINGGDMPERFTIDPTSGILKRADSGPLPSQVKVILVASDNGVPRRISEEVSLTLKFVADDGSIGSISGGPPKFTEPVYRASISEDARIGSFVSHVTAKSGKYLIKFMNIIVNK